MFVTVVLLFLSYQVYGDDIVKYRCGDDGAGTSVTFTPAVDVVEGRYTLELCTLKNPNITQWHVYLFYYEVTARCRKGRKPDLLHSVIKERIIDPTNCTNVCYSADFDLIFNGCYNILSEFEINNKRWLRPIDTYITINNTITKEMYQKNKPHVSFIPDQKKVTLHWYLGLPVTFYEVIITPRKNSSVEYSDKRINATEFCAVVMWNEVRCRLELPEGCYRASFQHNSTWTSVFNEQANVDYSFCRSRGAPPVLAGGAARAWWAGGAALLCAAALAAAALARRALRTRTYHKHVLHAWRQARECEAPRPLETPTRNILLLYAREGEHGQRAVDALKVLLKEATGCQVIDVMSAETTAAAASAPGAWLRGALLSSDSRVLLLQSPALAALYATHVQQNTLNLSEPLLGRRALYRCPQFGDQLLLLALRLLGETPAEHHHYHKYYLATYASLPAEVCGALVPYRRYALPRAARALLRDLAPARAHTSDTAHYERAVDEFVLHVKENPDYLMDELIIM